MAAKKAASEPPPPPAAVVALFSELSDPEDPEIISLEGLQKLGEQLGLDAASDVRFLVLLWKLGSGSKAGCITRAEFTAGMHTMRKSNLEALRQSIPACDPGFLEQKEFREFYKFVFQFNREGTRRFIEKEIAIDLMRLVLDTNRAPHLELFIKYLESRTKPNETINLDEWSTFLQFNQMVRLDLADYNEDNAFPLLLGDYVTWRKEEAAGGAPAAK